MAVVLKVQERAVRPRSTKKKLREEGRVPAIVYGNKIENTPISVDAKELLKALRENGQNAVFTLDINGKKIPTLLFDEQVSTFTREWKHVEFIAVDMDEATEVEAEIALIGTPKGVKLGGELAQNLYNVMVSATPDKLPDRVEVNIEHMEIGDAITLGDIPVNPDYEIVGDMEEQVASVEEAKDHEETEAGTEASTPEVIGEKEE